MPKLIVCYLLAIAFALCGCTHEVEVGPNDILPDQLQINQIQVIGSHNSYRKRTYDPILTFAIGLSQYFPAGLDPNEWDYEHIPLDEQFLDYGIRQIELDIYYDPDGGRFANRQGNLLVSEPAESGIYELDQPGFKVLHVPDLDYQTHYYTFKQSLVAVRDWSTQHQYHLPIFILIEAKETDVGAALPFFNFTEVLEFDLNAMNAIDEEIKEVFGEDLEKVITPDDVRGGSATLNEAILTKGWPQIGDSRGKVIFLFNNGGNERALYLQGHPSLQGRVMFTSSGTGKPESAFILANEPETPGIPQWVSDGYIVRTRADAGTYQARTGDISSRETAFASGAQFVSTDYYKPDERHTTDSSWTDYKVCFPNGAVARVNPVNGPLDLPGSASNDVFLACYAKILPETFYHFREICNKIIPN